MASSTPKKSFSPSPSAAGVNYYKQFAFNFIRPYGKADGVPSQEQVFRRLKPFNCEWLGRPKFGISEMAETIVTNMNMLCDEEKPSFMDNGEGKSIPRPMPKCWSQMKTPSTLLWKKKISWTGVGPLLL